MGEERDISLERLLKLRRATRALAGDLEKELRGYLETLAPLVRPKRLLGDLIAGASTESYPEAEKAFAQLQELFGKVAERPFRLRPHLDRPVPAIRVRLEIHPWEEPWSAPEGGSKLRVVSPLTWTLSYPGGCSLGSLRRMLAGEEPRNDEEIRQLVLNGCILDLLLQRSPGFGRLLEGLRYQLEVRRPADLGEVPIPVVRSVLPSVRPPPRVMLEAAEMAGLSQFEEVIDPDAGGRLEDPLRARLQARLAEHDAG